MKKINFLVVLLHLLPIGVSAQTGRITTIPPSVGKVTVNESKPPFTINGAMPRNSIDETGFHQVIDKKDSITIEKKPTTKKLDDTSHNLHQMANQPIYTKMSEARYYEWRESKGYYNDSVGQRELYYSIIGSAYPEKDSLEKSKMWFKQWGKYISNTRSALS